MGRRNFVTRWAQGGMIFTIYAYRATLGPLLGGQCRFHPTCSEYGIEAVREWGPLKGGWMAVRRILRCHPFSAGGFDPVPPGDAPTALKPWAWRVEEK